MVSLQCALGGRTAGRNNTGRRLTVEVGADLDLRATMAKRIHESEKRHPTQWEFTPSGTDEDLDAEGGAPVPPASSAPSSSSRESRAVGKKALVVVALAAAQAGAGAGFVQPLDTRRNVAHPASARATKKRKKDRWLESSTEESEAGFDPLPLTEACPGSPGSDDGSSSTQMRTNVSATAPNVGSNGSTLFEYGSTLPHSRSDGQPQSGKSDGPEPHEFPLRAQCAAVDEQSNTDDESDTGDDGSSTAEHTLGQVLGSVLPAKRAHNGRHKRTPSIYKLTSPADHSYVGQTVWPVKRINRHKNLKGKSKCRAIGAAIEFYGWEKMRVEWLFGGPVGSGAPPVSECDLDTVEKQMIARHRTYYADGAGYNLTRGGDKNPVSDELVRQRMAEMYQSQEWRDAQRAGYTPRVRAHIANAHKERQAKGGYAQITAAGHLGHVAANKKSNLPDAKAKRKATWDAKREAKLATMNPAKAALVRRQSELDAARLKRDGPPEGYNEYQKQYRAKQRAEKLAARTPGNCEYRIDTDDVSNERIATGLSLV